MSPILKDFSYYAFLQLAYRFSLAPRGTPATKSLKSMFFTVVVGFIELIVGNKAFCRIVFKNKGKEGTVV